MSQFPIQITKTFLFFDVRLRAPTLKIVPPPMRSGVATHWILWINPGEARCWRAAKCDNVLNGQRQSH